jgi:hypothetical protein
MLGPNLLRAQACALNVSSGAITLSNTSLSYCSLTVAAGATLVIGGSVTLNVTGNVDIEGLVTGAAQGYGSIYAPSSGPGAGGNGSVTTYSSSPSYSGGGGGGHGGAGGGSLPTDPRFSGGVTYDSPTFPVSMGSAGGTAAAASGPGQPGGAGGAALLLSAPSGYVTLNGTIDMSGGVGAATTVYNAGAGGGGAGGTISIDALGIGGTGSLLAAGGAGGGGSGSDSNQAGGGGGGGCVRLCASDGVEGFSGTLNASGGLGGWASTICGIGCNTFYGPAGQAGTYYDCNPTPTVTATPTSSATPSPTFTPTATPTRSATPAPSSTPTVTDSPTETPLSPCDQFSVSLNLFRPSQGDVLLQVAECTWSGNYSLKIYNSAGEYILTLDDRKLDPPFSQTYHWNGTNRYGDACASGVYLLRLSKPTGAEVKKLILVR